MHSHGNPKRDFWQNSYCIAAMQFSAGWIFALPIEALGGATRYRPVVTLRIYRRTVASDSSAELCAASANLAEIAAVSAGVPQLGASLPSPQARGR